MTQLRIQVPDAEKYALICPALGLPKLPDSADEVLQSDLPALLLQGGMDPATPQVGGDNVQTGLSNSFMAVVPAGAHIQSGNPCIGSIMRAFMSDPQSKPDTSCIDPSLPFRFPGPVVYLFADDNGAYRIIFQIVKPDLAEALRSKTLPAILETVTVGKE